MSFFLSLSTLTLLLLSILTKTNESADLNVGTTLFTKADSCKECWSSENLALLTSRMILEDLLPSTSILVIDCDEFVGDLVEYFRLILEIVRHETHGKTKHITLLALTDLIGGYLHHAVLPIAKYSYYAGHIDYDSMATLLGLFDELKWFLRTNGQGWARPLTQTSENFEVQRIPLQPNIDKDLCQNLIFVEGENKPNEQSSTQCNAIIPLPFFDSVTRPSAIALPTKTCPLHSVDANTSSYLVMKFFVTAYKCLQVRNAKTENIEKFQNDFNAWIEEQIIPRLQDEKFYSAFGGILRVRNTVKKLCMSQQPGDKDEDYRQGGEISEDETLSSNGNRMSRTGTILAAVLITFFVWFLLGTLFICYKMRATREKGKKIEDPSEKTTTTESLASSKYFYPEKAKPFKKGETTPEVEHSDLDVSSYQKRRVNKSHNPLDSLHYHKLNWSRENQGKGRVREIVITKCRCSDDEDVTPTSVVPLESSPTEGRLPSIEEISEQSTTSNKRTPSKKSKSGGTTTPGSQDRRRGKVQKTVYMDTESETEETSEPA